MNHIDAESLKTNKPDTLQALVDQFSAFLTIAIHVILFERDLYPKASFLSARAYNFPVRQSRHPGVCTWVNDAVTAAAAELEKGIVARLAFVIFHPQTSKPLERFVWDVSNWPVLSRSEIQTHLIREDRSKMTTLEDVDLDEQLRAVLTKLSSCGSRLGPLPTGCTFTLAIELKQDSDPPLDHPQPWIPSDPALQRTKIQVDEKAEADSRPHGEEKIERGSDIGGRKTTPVRRVESGEMLFAVWIEEGKAKADLGLATSVEPSRATD